MAAGDDSTSVAVEYAKCAADAAYFTDQYGLIDDSQGLGLAGGLMPFRLWPAQIRVMWTLMARRLIIILKARQLGISWLCCSYALWLCLFQPGKLVLLYSQGELEAGDLLRRIKALHDRLPAWLRAVLPPVIRDTSTEFGWSNGSMARSLPATQKAGRSFTASLVILDEAAYLMWASKLYRAMKPTIDGGGQLVVLSTADGEENLFHRIWTRAVEGLNGFTTIFLAWWERPGRDAAWYAAQVAEADDTTTVKQEYPANPIEAFQASGNTRFDSRWIAAQLENIEDPIPERELPEALTSIPGLKVWRLPEPGHEYVLGGDVAEGLEHGDFDACPVLDAETWEQVAEIHGHYEPDEYARYLVRVADFYGFAWVWPERNNHGHAVLTAFALATDPETLLPMPFTRVGNGHDGRPGWLTNVQTKGPMIDLVAQALRDECLIVRSAGLLHELKVYRRLKGGKLGAPSGAYDDRVMGLAVALSGIQHRHLTPNQGAPSAAGTERRRTRGLIGGLAR